MLHYVTPVYSLASFLLGPTVISPSFSTPLQVSFIYRILFSLLHFILCRMCVCHMFDKVLTYLLTKCKAKARACLCYQFHEH